MRFPKFIVAENRRHTPSDRGIIDTDVLTANSAKVGKAFLQRADEMLKFIRKRADRNLVWIVVSAPSWRVRQPFPFPVASQALVEFGSPFLLADPSRMVVLADRLSNETGYRTLREHYLDAGSHLSPFPTPRVSMQVVSSGKTG